MLLYAWALSTYQNLGIFECFSNYYHQVKKLPYIKFFDILFEYCEYEKSIFSDELKIVENNFDELFEGKGWDHYDPKLGDINWPIEEASWLRLVPNKQRLMDGSRLFLEFLENKEQLKFFDPAKKIGMQVANNLLKEGVIGRAMPHGDILGLSPPLCLNKSEVDIIISSLKKSLDKV